MQIDSFATTVRTTLFSPEFIKEKIPLDAHLKNQILESRKTVSKILRGEDPRTLLIVGPCSIHDSTSALEFATNLAQLTPKVSDRFFPIMRVYCEKPRTLVGWKGMLYDPDLNGLHDIPKGIITVRTLMHKIASLGVSIATEFLDPIAFHYYYDLVTWGSVGARTSASQIHRQVASGLPIPIGFKNSTTGCIQEAIIGAASAHSSHMHIGLSKDGSAEIFKTTGNPDAHLVLRGGSLGPNYDPEAIETARKLLDQHQISNRIIIDCSHGNSGRDPSKQQEILLSSLENNAIAGFMLESHISTGSQTYSSKKPLNPYMSITDPCLGWKETENLILKAAKKT